MLTDIKLIKAQISKIIQSGRFLSFWFNQLGKKVVTGLVIPFPRDRLPGLVSNIALNADAINKFERKIGG